MNKEKCGCGKEVFALGIVWLSNGNKVAAGEGKPVSMCNECAESLWNWGDGKRK